MGRGSGITDLMMSMRKVKDADDIQRNLNSLYGGGNANVPMMHDTAQDTIGRLRVCENEA
jgi:hypothetical protein